MDDIADDDDAQREYDETPELQELLTRASASPTVRLTPPVPDDDWDPDEETQAVLADPRAMAAIREAEDPNAEYTTLEEVEAIVQGEESAPGSLTDPITISGCRPASMHEFTRPPRIDARQTEGAPKVADTTRLGDRLGLKITSLVGTMICAAVFAVIALVSLPTTLEDRQHRRHRAVGTDTTADVQGLR
jgi:hypothetical protein